VGVSYQADATRARRFDEQISPYLAILYRAALRLAGTAPDAEDLVQETCLRAFRALDQLREPAAAKVWVFAILRSVFLRRVKRQAAELVVAVDDLDTAVRSSAGLSWQEDTPLRRALLEEVRQATIDLPLVYREPIVLAHVAGFSYREMAQILEIPVGTVMSRLFRARRLLSRALAEPTRRDHRPKSSR
jgi:RNA polymerase sigma-70 factor, ECF subfamily